MIIINIVTERFSLFLCSYLYFINWKKNGFSVIDIILFPATAVFQHSCLAFYRADTSPRWRGLKLHKENIAKNSFNFSRKPYNYLSFIRAQLFSNQVFPRPWIVELVATVELFCWARLQDGGQQIFCTKEVPQERFHFLEETTSFSASSSRSDCSLHIHASPDSEFSNQ